MATASECTCRSEQERPCDDCGRCRTCEGCECGEGDLPRDEIMGSAKYDGRHEVESEPAVQVIDLMDALKQALARR